MSNFESIVPPLELCRMIPAGEFEDSVLTWRERIGDRKLFSRPDAGRDSGGNP